MIIHLENIRASSARYNVAMDMFAFHEKYKQYHTDYSWDLIAMFQNMSCISEDANHPVPQTWMPMPNNHLEALQIHAPPHCLIDIVMKICTYV